MTHLEYFGTDGIRGTAGKKPMTADFVLRLGRAAGQVLGGRDLGRPTFMVGRDSRLSGQMLQSALTAGLLASGADVVDLGVVPTPAVAFLTRQTGADAGVVISASHNPAAENGIKFMTAAGMKLSEELELAIEHLLAADMSEAKLAHGFGTVRDGFALRQAYMQDLQRSVAGLDMSGLRIVLDCANGAASTIAPAVFAELGAEVLSLHAVPDGLNINLDAGSEYVRSFPEVFGRIIKQEGADMGIAFDGDADRVILMDENGRLVDGDHVLAVLADYLGRRGQLAGNALVSTSMANGSLKQFAKDEGLALIETPVGDKYVTEALMRLAALPENTDKFGLGGEQSGHVILLDEEHRTGDGIRTALFLMKVLYGEEHQKLSSVVDRIQKYPQLIASCVVASKIRLEEIEPLNALLAAMRTALPGLVELNLRYSGTEPKFRLMVEADRRHTAADLAHYAWQVCTIVQSETGTALGASIEVMNVSDGGLMPRPRA